MTVVSYRWRQQCTPPVFIDTKHALCCQQADVLLKEAQERFEHVFDLHETIFVLDATSVTSPALKHLKGYLSEAKVKVTQVSPSVQRPGPFCSPLRRAWRDRCDPNARRRACIEL